MSSKVEHGDTSTAELFDWDDFFEERAAHREFDGGYTRAEAERLAWGELQSRWQSEHGERVSPSMCAGCRRPIGRGLIIDLIDGGCVHDQPDHACLIRHGKRWRIAATEALTALGLKLPRP